MCRAYIAAHPSEHPSIRCFGRYMSDFLSHTPPYCEHEILLEMSRFEWAKSKVFDTSNSDALASIEQLAAIEPQHWGAMRFEFVPAICRLQFHNNVSLLWDAIKQAADALPDLQRTDGSVPWIVWRKGLDPHWRSLDIDESFALDYCEKGVNFAGICDCLCEWVDEQHAPMHPCAQ